jgi:hypothetical protein
MKAQFMLKSRKLRLAALLFCSLISSGVAFGGEVATVHFCPFNLSTFVPLTTSAIMKGCMEKWTITDESKIARLTQLLSQGHKHKFDEEMVRVAAIVGGQTYFIDSYGVVKNGARSYKIDKKQFLEFRDSLSANEVEKPN